MYRILILRKLVHIFGKSLKMNKVNIFKQIFTRDSFFFFSTKNFIPSISIYLYLFPPIEVGKTQFRHCHFEIIFFCATISHNCTRICIFRREIRSPTKSLVPIYADCNAISHLYYPARRNDVTAVR